MKKKSKLLLIGIISILGVFTTISVFAGQYWFYLSIPRAQGFDVTEDDTGNGYITGGSASSADVYIEGFSGISAVTFYAGAYSSDGKVTWSTKGNWINRSDFEEGKKDEVSVPYQYTYGKGQKMGLKARNHNWSLNTGVVNGTVDYH